MHGIGKGKEATNIKGRQGGTCFDCSKLKKKWKTKSLRRVFLNTDGILGRREGVVVFTETGQTQQCVGNAKTISFSKTIMPAPNKELNSRIIAEFHGIKSKKLFHSRIQS